MNDLLRTTAERAARYLAGLKDRSVAPTPQALANLQRLDEALADHPTEPTAVIALLDDIGSPGPLGSAARLEEVAMRRLLDLLGLPPTSGVGFVTCATQANFSGLAASRHALLARR